MKEGIKLKSVKKVITKEMVINQLEEIVENQDLSRYIL